MVLLLAGVVLMVLPNAYKDNWFGGLAERAGRRTVAVEGARQNALGKNSQEEPIRIDGRLLSQKESLQPPLRVVVPKAGIDLSVVEAKVVDGYWELSETTASHGVGSANPGEIGNTVIFAHAREGLFLPLRNIAESEAIYVMTKDRWQRYKVATRKLVDPSHVEVIAPTNDEVLTLFTCSGFLDSKRLVVTAKPDRP